MNASTTAALPPPDEHAAAHSLKLLDKLQQRLQSGPVTFADYMQLALYEPGMGYYMAGVQKFGERGDFVTAPEVSELFGQCLAAQCREVLSLLDGGSILEFGAGSGRLAATILNAMADAAPQHYFILEPSAELQQRQLDYLTEQLDSERLASVSWLDKLPQDFVGVCIANEVMDALPVELFEKQPSGVMQLCVGNSDSGLALCSRAAPEPLSKLVCELENELGIPFADGYRSEVNMLLSPWIATIAQAMKQGVLLLSDYGYPRREYYLPERREGTLACYYQHHFHDDVFFHPGLQDITAHVDFTRVVEAGSAAGLALLGYTSQSSFLLDNGITVLAAAQMEACNTEQEQLTLARNVKMLTLPGEMGERFQFMALGKNLASSLQGFASQDLSHRL